MDGFARRSLPPTVRSFAPSRLAEDLMSSVYERLLATKRWRDPLPETSGRDEVCVASAEVRVPVVLEAIATGGRS